MFKRTLIAAALIATGFAGSAIADDATDSLADKMLTELQMDTVTAGGDARWIEILSFNPDQSTPVGSAQADNSHEVLSLNYQQVRLSY